MTDATADTQVDLRAVRDTDISDLPPVPDSLPEGLSRISHVELLNEEPEGPPSLDQQVTILGHTTRAIADRMSGVNAIVSDMQAEVTKIGKRAERSDEVAARQNQALTILLARSTKTRSESLAGKVVLVIENDELLLAPMRTRLAEAGAAVYYERDALHARIRLETIGPANLSCAVLDVRLPDSEGTELAHDIRKRAPASGIVLTSGWPLVAYEEESERDGYTLLDKPFDPHELIDAVLAAIQLRGGA